MRQAVRSEARGTARRWLALLLLLAACLPFAGRAAAQGQSTYWPPYGPAPVANAPTYLSPAELEQLVARVALYPDELLAAILPAATQPLQVVQAMRFLEARRHDPTLRARSDWDISIIALLNYPDVLRMMSDDLDWTSALGDAVVLQRQAVMDAIQQYRLRVYTAGNLYSDDHIIVTHTGGLILIQSVDPEVIYVPVYDPWRVLVRRPVPLPAPIIVFSPPYRAYYVPRATFFTGLFFGVAIGFGFDWHHHDIDLHRGVRVERRAGHRSRVQFDESRRWREHAIERRRSERQPRAVPPRERRREAVPPPRPRVQQRPAPQPRAPALRRDERPSLQPERAVPPQRRRTERPGDRRAPSNYLGGYERGRSAVRNNRRGDDSRAAQQMRDLRPPRATQQAPARSRVGRQDRRLQGGAFRGVEQGGRAKAQGSRGAKSRQELLQEELR